MKSLIPLLRTSRDFVRNGDGNIALLAAFALVVIFGALAIAVDYSEVSRRRQEVYNALDASAIATGREMLKVSDESKLNSYAASVFKANLATVPVTDTAFKLTLPRNNTGGGT